MAYNRYPYGSTVKMTANFTRADTGVNYDPTTVSLKIKDPSGMETVVSPLTPQAVGSYIYEMVVTISGEWEYRFEGVGGLTAAGGPAGFTVEDEF